MRLFIQPPSAGSSGKPLLMVTLFLLWLSLNAFLLVHNGIVTSGEAEAYTTIAPAFLRLGHLPAANLWLYSVPIALIAFSIKFHLGYSFVVGVQLLFNVIATWYFFDTVRSLFAYSPSATRRAALATAILLLDIPYQTFNTFLQTESLFHSFSILLTCYCIRQKHPLVLALAGTALLCLTRPIGLLYIPPIVALYYYHNVRTSTAGTRILFLTILTGSFLFLLDLVIGSGGQFDFLLPFTEEHIICGAPTLITPASPTGVTTIFDLAAFIFRHPLTFLRLAALRSLSFWGIYRSWYSAAHNTWLLAFFIPLIVVAGLSIRHWRRQNPVALLYISIIILLTWGTVIMTCDDWSNRIFLSITPFIILLAAGFRLEKQ